MSRLRKLKAKKRKKFIKTIMSGLALTLAIGAGQTITTYAWFTDEKSIKSDLTITMGNLDVSIMSGFTEEGLKKSDTRQDSFNIKNNGTLKQHLSVSLNGIRQETGQWIDYEIKFNNYKGKAIKPISVSNLISGEVNLTYADGSLVILDAGDAITATASININENTPEDLVNSFVEEPLQFRLTVKATQVNSESSISTYGFSDTATQENLLRFDKIEFQDEEILNEEIEVPTEPEVIEPPKEEVIEPSEPEVIEPPKEEVIEPSEPEVIEPPKEEAIEPSDPEIIEPPKQDIIEIPNKPEIIEPPMENEGIQE